MANAPPGGAPGSAGHAPNTYPQWGFNQAGKITEARNEAAKLADMNKGYLDWFTSKAAASNAWKGMQGPLGKGLIANPLAGLAAVGDFFQRLTQAGTWARVGQVVLGAALIIIGLARMASGTAAGSAAVKAGKAAAIL
jgi:hypothetical protein